MGRRRRREERIEIHERLIVRTASGSLPALCDACSASDGSSAGDGSSVVDAILLSPEHASTLTRIPTRVIYRLVEAEAIHYREAANGRLVVCVKTLIAARERVVEA